jgi:hypothetical protein
MNTRTLKCGKKIPAIGMEGCRAEEIYKRKMCAICDKTECIDRINAIIVEGGGKLLKKGSGGSEAYGFIVYWNEPTTEDTLCCDLKDLTPDLVKSKNANVLKLHQK